MCLVCLLLCKEDSSPVSTITERRDMGLYEVTLSMALLDYVSHDHILLSTHSHGPC